ncbi:hypothetical protein N9F51_00540 [bacterium]|nr:hypothetical protein [bacterium]
MGIKVDNFEESPLSAVTATLLRNPDKVKEWLTIVDKHMTSYADNPEVFLLPKAHEFLKPLIEAYAHNLEGFTQYLLELRDNFDRRSLQFVEVQAIYRRLNGRFVQQSRRDRMARAIIKADTLFGEIAYTKRMQWMAELEHVWARRRLAFLEQQRKRLKQDRLSTELRTEMLLEFWDIIDTEIYEGNIPPWN